MKSVDEFALVADVFKQVGDASRVRIFWILCHFEENVSELAELCGMTAPDRIFGPKAVVPAEFPGSLPVFGAFAPVRRRMFFAGSGGLRRFRARAENSAASVRKTMRRTGVNGPNNNSRSDPASRKAGLHGQKKTFQSD